MRRVLTTLLCGAVLLVHPLQASAEVDARPGWNGAKVRLHALEEWKPKTRVPNSRHHSTHAIKPVKLNRWGGVPCATVADGATRCFGQPAIAPTQAKLDPGYVLEAAKRIGLPALKINIQPGNATLVNLDTIFYARPHPFARSVTLLGYDIDLTATPVLYTWHHGDGTSHTTSTPGAPYPSKDVTYRYQQPAEQVRPSVDVTYRVRYRVDGGAWQTLSQTLTATGQSSTLEVKEAGAVLTSY